MHRPFKQEFTHIAPAAFIKRLMAMVYDSLLVIALWMVIGAISVGLNDGEAISIETSSRTTVALFNSALFCATFLFLVFSGPAMARRWACLPGGCAFRPWPVAV